jgi:hypothetical protein
MMKGNKHMKITPQLKSINKAGLAEDQSLDEAFALFRAAIGGLTAERIERKYGPAHTQ